VAERVAGRVIQRDESSSHVHCPIQQSFCLRGPRLPATGLRLEGGVRKIIHRTQESCGRRKMACVIERIGPSPVVSQREILRILDPMLRGSQRARFQTLRDKKVVSGGIRRAVPASKGRLHGSIHLFSTLNRDSVRLYRQGNDIAAREVAREAASLEAEADFQELVGILATFASRNHEALRIVAEMPWRAVRMIEMTNAATQQMLLAAGKAAEAIRSTNHAIEEISRVLGWVDSIQDNLASILTLSGKFTLPAVQLQALGLDQIGAAVEVEWEQIDPGELIISTSGAVGSAELMATQPGWTAFSLPPRITVSASRFASLSRQLEEKAVAIPSIPLQVRTRT